MRVPMTWVGGGLLGVVLSVGGCPDDTRTVGGNGNADGGAANAGRNAAAGSGGGNAGSGASGRGGDGGSQAGGRGGSGGDSGGSGSGSGMDAGSANGACGPNTPIPALCRVCADGSCGSPLCEGGDRVTGWSCPEDSDSCGCMRPGYVPVCGSDGETYDANCGRSCVPVAIDCDGECPCEGSGELRWYETCGDPVCGFSTDPSDDPNIRNCTTEQLGEPCTNESDLCDGTLSCGRSLICAASDPTMGPGGCPRSRARYKDEVAYLSEQQLHAYHEQVMSLPLASYRYKHAEGAGPQLGFIIEDIEPSAAVSGDHVNMYGYLSMAVAAIQVQQQQIASLQQELDRLRAQLPAESALSCGP